MKKYVAAFSLIFICLSGIFSFAQSRRTPPTENGKANRREVKTAESPTSAPTTEEVAPPAEETPLIEDGEAIRVDTELVTVPVKILDRDNRLVANLKKEDFQIYEDDAPQEIAYFSNENQPFTVALILDMSYSAKFKAEEIQNAAIAFISQLRENDKIMVVSFDEEIHLLCEPTSDRKAIQAAVKKAKIASGTSLYDAVDLVISQRLKKIAGRKAVVLFTDGVDTTSRRAFAQKNISGAMELDALIYPIEYHTFNDVQAMKDKTVIVQPPTLPKPYPTPPSSNGSRFPLPAPPTVTGTPDDKGTSAEEYQKAHEYLENLATRTGGRMYKADTLSNLALAFSRIAAELREFYSLGYYPKTPSKAGQRVKIKVRVNQPKLVVRARDSYVVKKK